MKQRYCKIHRCELVQFFCCCSKCNLPLCIGCLSQHQEFHLTRQNSISLDSICAVSSTSLNQAEEMLITLRQFSDRRRSLSAALKQIEQAVKIGLQEKVSRVLMQIQRMSVKMVEEQKFSQKLKSQINLSKDHNLEELVQFRFAQKSISKDIQSQQKSLQNQAANMKRLKEYLSRIRIELDKLLFVPTPAATELKYLEHSQNY